MHFPPVSHLFQWEELFFEDTIFAINKTVLMLFLSTVIVLAIFVAGSRRQALVPRGIQNVAEVGYDLIEQNVSLEVMNPDDGKRWTPFFVVLFFWIFFLNVFGIVPFLQFPAGSRFAIPLYLALQTYVIMLFMGFKAQGPKYITNSIFPPGVPWPLYILVTPIELISVFAVRPFSLAVRLFANLMAGHILLAVFALMCAALWSTQWYVALLPLPFAMSVAMTLFELLVAVLQAYIFTILTAVYVNESMHPAH